ncbi:MAG: hypothetical protein ABI895_13230 [Deltaproteobacteria bacterium]
MAPRALRAQSASTAGSSASCGSRLELPPPVTDLQTITERVPATTDVLTAVGDAQGLYWIEADGSVLGLASGSTSSVTLRSATASSTAFTGIFADERRVYWTEASRELAEQPTEIFSAPKLEARPELSIASNEFLYPLGVAGPDLLFVTRGGQVQAAENGALRPLDHIRSSTQPQIVNGALYWLDQSTDPSRLDVFSASVAPGVAQRWTSFEGSLGPTGVSGGPRFETIIPPSYLIGPGFVLWSTLQLLDEQQTPTPFLRHIDLETGCIMELPNLGALRPPILLDGQHVYWLSYDPTPIDQPQTLLRLNLETDAIERVGTPGLELPFSSQLMAQDGGNIYVQIGGSGSLVAVHKPE